jgi:hypothetical protein
VAKHGIGDFSSGSFLSTSVQTFVFAPEIHFGQQFRVENHPRIYETRQMWKVGLSQQLATN